MPTIEELSAKHRELRAAYAQLDPAEVHKAIYAAVSSDLIGELVTEMVPLFEALPNDDPVKVQLGNWLQINKTVPHLIKQHLT